MGKQNASIADVTLQPNDEGPGRCGGVLRRLWPGRPGRVTSIAAVVLSSHLLHLVEELCTRILVIRQGQAVAIGTMADIVSSRPELQGRTLEEMFIALTGDSGPVPTA